MFWFMAYTRCYGGLGSDVCGWGERLACAVACLACARRFAGGLRASARQFVSSQMRYNKFIYAL